MKRKLFPFFLLFAVSTNAQLFIPLEELADQEIGWVQIRKFTQPAKPLKSGNRSYSAKQVRNCELFIEWLQQSYLPKGCLGNTKYYLNALPGVSYESQLKNALPHMYGAYAQQYMFLKKDAKGKLVPQTGLSDYWRIEVNQLEYISNGVPFISTPDQYYFVMPYYHDNAKSDYDFKKEDEFLGFRNNPNIASYTHFYQPKNSGAGLQYVVLMSPNKKMPFEEVTIGEFLTQAQQQLPEWQKRENRSHDLLMKAQQNLNRIIEKYKNRWNEVARLRSPWGQISFYDFVNATPGYDDMLEHHENITTFPLLKVNKTAMALTKTDQPQWIVIRWDAGLTNSSYAVHKMESILNNFNFNYVHDYFFAPDKIKGQAYQPLRSLTEKKPVILTAASEESKKAAADKNVLFFDDFSSSPANTVVNGWTSNLVNGKRAFVIDHNAAGGKWLELQGHSVVTSFIKKPLSENFELSYNVSVPKGFTWGGKRLDMVLAKDNNSTGASFRFSISPGYDGREGETQVENNFGQGFENGTKWYKAPGFSNNTNTNKVTVRIRKTGEGIQVYIDHNKIADYPKAMPANQQFNFLKFSHIGSSDETQKYFITDIRIIKL